jgi:hypothetical protein
MPEKVNVDISDFVLVVCPGCGVEFLIRETLANERPATVPIYCPNGHKTREKRSG